MIDKLSLADGLCNSACYNYAMMRDESEYVSNIHRYVFIHESLLSIRYSLEHMCNILGIRYLDNTSTVDLLDLLHPFYNTHAPFERLRKELHRIVAAAGNKRPHEVSYVSPDTCAILKSDMQTLYYVARACRDGVNTRTESLVFDVYSLMRYFKVQPTVGSVIDKLESLKGKYTDTDIIDAIVDTIKEEEQS